MLYSKEGKGVSGKKMPDLTYIYKELLKMGSAKSSYGQNTWNNAASAVLNRLCILTAPRNHAYRS
ncbi:hypothetical protein ALO_14947 [Acetonema longum DSM 6540]|uniref:Uncharacterized protein n=1 Tax=Acetonema longum DSM 6540 TaxID=1009370 RepID=F7NLL5_9FIRM|nr:hypothetical protein ALO_14947 [Acetonema longum DSM 6540]